MSEVISTDAAPAAIGPYSQAMRSGDTIYCSGQVAIDPSTGELVEGGVVEQTERVLRNLEAVLRAAGASFENVVKTTVYLTRMADFAAMNEIYAKRFGGHAPARATVEVAALPKGAMVEIDCIARI